MLPFWDFASDLDLGLFWLILYKWEKKMRPGLQVIKLEYSLKLKTRGPDGPEALTWSP